MLLEIAAATGGTPQASRTGKVNSVPEPTNVLMAPAPAPAARTATASHTFMHAPGPVLRTSESRAVYGPPLRRRGPGRSSQSVRRRNAAQAARADQRSP